MKAIRIGIAGFGSAGRSLAPAILAHPEFVLHGVADPNAAVRAEVRSSLGCSTYEDLSSMAEQRDLDAVYVATPTQMHEEHALHVLGEGKHLLLEKPMGINVAQGLRIAQAAERSGRILVVGHSHGFDRPIQAMRALIEAGELGAVRMVSNNCYTDWMHRPRRNDELDVAQGGGVIYRQGSHQFDIIRLLCGGVAKKIRASAYSWDPDRPGLGAYSSWISFANDAVATVVYSGYGNLNGEELCFNISEGGRLVDLNRFVPRAQRGLGELDSGIAEAKQARARAMHANSQGPMFQPFFGLTIVNCEKGDMRQSPKGLFVYTQGRRYEVNLDTDRGPRDLVLDEFSDAIQGKGPPVHDARWALANLELCDAAVLSSRLDRELELEYQVPPAAMGCKEIQF